MEIALGNRRQVWLLAAVVVMEMVNPLLAFETPAARIVAIVLFFVVALVVFYTVLGTTRRRWLGAALAGPAIAIELGRTLLPQGAQPQLAVISGVSVVAFLAFTVFVIVQQVLRTRTLGIDDVVGAFAGYLIIALLWGRLYALVWLLAPGSFSIAPAIAWQLDHWHTQHALFDYYSMVTLATVGYGDVTTTGPASNTLRWLEVMCGQFYLAVVVATIVGMKLAQALTPTTNGDR
jgi:hypothetical protein